MTRLYGTFDGLGQTGAYCGTVFKLQPPSAAGGSWTETTLYSFAAISDACIPVYAPVFGADGGSWDGVRCYDNSKRLRSVTLGAWQKHKI